MTKKDNNCIDCNKLIWRCSKRCISCAASGSNGSQWKGGIIKRLNGYVFRSLGKGHPLGDRNGYMREAHYVWLRENDWGMLFIPKGWIVHHINEIKDDNRIENLICVPDGLHKTYHNIIRYKKQMAVQQVVT